jgi:D-amino-acid dehydrogenase
MQDETDILIVGGGIIGLSCAYYLNAAGRSVRLVERETIGSGASHGNCGMVCPSHAPPLTQPGVVARGLKGMMHRGAPLHIRPTLNPRTLSWLMRFAARCSLDRMRPAMAARAAILNSSRTAFDELIAAESLAEKIEWTTNGALFVCRQAATMALTGDYFSRAAEVGVAAIELSGAELTAKEPALRDDLAGGFFVGSDAHLRPDRLVSELQRVVTERGVVIEENTPVQGLIADGSMATGVDTDSGPRHAKTVVVAAGAWSSTLKRSLRASVPIEPGKGYSITTTRPKICPTHPIAFQERGCIATPFNSGYRLGGTMEFAGFDDRLRKVRIESIRRAATEYMREPEGETVEEEWYGWRPMTYDGVPIIDRLPSYDNAYLAAGHNMLGISMATGTGKLVSELVTDAEPHIDPQPYSFDRL